MVEINEDNQTEQNIKDSKPFFLGQKNKKSLIKLSLLLIIVISVLIVSFFMYGRLAKDNTSSACLDRNEGSLLFNANKVFKENTTVVTKEQVDTLIEQVKTIDSFENEANCLYPIMYSYIQNGEYQKASDEYDNFADAYVDGEYFASDIYPMNSLEELKNLIDFSLKNSTNTTRTSNGVILMGEPMLPEGQQVNQ